MDVFWSRKDVAGYRPEVRVFATLTKIGCDYYLFGGENTVMNNSVRILNGNTYQWKIAKTTPESL